MKIKNRLRSYIGRTIKAYTDQSEETTLQITSIPLIEPEDILHDPFDEEDDEEGEDLRLQCDGCKRTIEILCDKQGAIIGARCPICHQKIVAS